MPGYDDTLVVIPAYRLLVTMRFRTVPPLAKYKPSGTDRATVPVCKGAIDLSGYGYPFDRYAAIIITDIAEDFSALTLIFDGSKLEVPLDGYISVERAYEITDPAHLLPPNVVPARNRRMFGDYLPPPAPQREIIEARFCLYRVFEDIYQEAYYYLKQAEAGNVKAQFIISSLLYNGTGIHKSRKEAREWAQRAKAAGGAENTRVYGDAYGWWVT